MTTTIQDSAVISIGRATSTIDVMISHRIVQLFSEGLYTSPNKAVEELVTNGFDAGAQRVHVLLAPDLTQPEASIAVLDDGEGMDEKGLREHWIIGHSPRRNRPSKSGRKPIGKFGIGKLATYVLARRLTHVSKFGGKYLAATMDFRELGSGGESAGVFNEESVSIPLRELSEAEAKEALRPWITGNRPGHKALVLFGESSRPTWTASILTDLTQMGQKVQRGRLAWILRTAMPLRDDFILYLNGDRLEPSKVDLPIIDRWTIGKDITGEILRPPAPDDLVAQEDGSKPADAINRYGLSHQVLGRVTGYVELFRDELTGGKSADLERSHGFFVYVRGRMINADEPGFGIERNLLRHGTFSRFRAVVHIDSLDEALRSSRESIEQGELSNLSRDLLRALFNLVRNRLQDHERSETVGALTATMVSGAPGSLTRRPLVSVTEKALAGTASPRYLKIPDGLDLQGRQDLMGGLRDAEEADEALLLTTELIHSEASEPLAVYDVAVRALLVNASHPFVASFHELYEKASSSQPLEMYAMAEILTEANLYHMGVDEGVIHDVMESRDELLRQFVRSSARRTVGMIALGLQDAKDDENQLEIEVRAAFEAIGFDDVKRIGGPGKPDGTAEAYLSAKEDGSAQRYRVGLEAKSGGVVSAKRLGVSGIARHMKKFGIDHHVVIGNGFATSKEEDSASVQEINEHKGKTGKDDHLDHDRGSREACPSRARKADWSR